MRETSRVGPWGEHRQCIEGQTTLRGDGGNCVADRWRWHEARPSMAAGKYTAAHGINGHIGVIADELISMLSNSGSGYACSPVPFCGGQEFDA